MAKELIESKPKPYFSDFKEYFIGSLVFSHTQAFKINPPDPKNMAMMGYLSTFRLFLRKK